MRSNVKVVELGEVLPALPEMETFSPASPSGSKHGALLLCALGFESRCLSIPEQLSANGYSFDQAIYFEYDSNREDNQTNRPSLIQHLDAVCQNVTSTEAYEPGFYSRMRQLLESIVAKSEADAAPVVVFDVSVASNRLLMRCLKVLLEFDIDLTVLYSEAAVYYPSREEYESDPERWSTDETIGLEQGVRYVHTSEQYPGYHIDQLPDCVLLLPSFKPQRSRAVLSAIDPSLVVSPGENVIWLLGKPHLPEDAWRLEAMRKINQVPANSTQYEVDTFHYKDAVRVLESIYRERSNTFRFTLSPIGSKMQALGSAVACYLHPDIRVIFSAPQQFNASHYSTGCKAMWALHFGGLGKVRNALNTVGDIQIVEETQRERERDRGSWTSVC